ncbi:MAG: hemolysin family protein [Chloroflexota bacterium]
MSEGLPALSTLTVPSLVILLLVLVNGLFVAAEFAIISVRPSQLEQKAQEGVGRAAQVLAVLDSPAKQDRYIATAQLGITVASLGLGMYGEQQVAHFVEPYLAYWLQAEPPAAFVHTVASAASLGLLTYLHIVVGEMVPKSLALAASFKAALLVAAPMRLSEAILVAPVRLLNAIGGVLLRLLRVPPAEGHARLHSSEELELIVAESAEGGMLNEDEEEIILNIFDFSERQVGQVMTPRPKVQAIAHDVPQAELLKLVTESRHSRFPVYKGDLDHVLGILHVKDLVRQQISTKGQLDVRLLLRPALAIPEDYPVEQLLAAFKRQRMHMAVVLDEFGGVAGIVTLEDLVEEVVGEVRDEFDVEKEPLVELGPGLLEVAGSYLLDNLKDYVYLGPDEDLPDVETVGGLIVTRLGRPPRIGDKLIYPGDLHFTVLDVDGRAVARAKIEYPLPEEEMQNDE